MNHSALPITSACLSLCAVLLAHCCTCWLLFYPPKKGNSTNCVAGNRVLGLVGTRYRWLLGYLTSTYGTVPSVGSRLL